MKIPVHLTPDEYAQLRAKAALIGVSVPDLLAQFAADLAGSMRSRGSDERDVAQGWLERGYNLYPEYDSEDADPESELRCRRAVRWRSLAQKKRNQERVLA